MQLDTTCRERLREAIGELVASRRELKATETKAKAASREEYLHGHADLLRKLAALEARNERRRARDGLEHEYSTAFACAVSDERLNSPFQVPLPMSNRLALVSEIIDAIPGFDSGPLVRLLDQNRLSVQEARPLRTIVADKDRAWRHASYVASRETAQWRRAFNREMNELSNDRQMLAAYEEERRLLQRELGRREEEYEKQIEQAARGRLSLLQAELESARALLDEAEEAWSCRENLRAKAKHLNREFVKSETNAGRIRVKEAMKNVTACRAACIEEYKDNLDHDFLATVLLDYSVKGDARLGKELETSRISHVQEWAWTRRPHPLDDEQASAVAAVQGAVLVAARAGSGKTGVIVARAAFLVEKCKISPDHLMLLAFNKDAAEEMSKRLLRELRCSMPHTLTFHALANRVVRPKNKLKCDSEDTGLELSRFVQEVVNAVAADSELGEQMRSLMLSHWREDWGRLIEAGLTLPQEQGLAFRRSLRHDGLDGRRYKSFGEKAISNFLFEHGLDYNYEENHPWDGLNYHPDFTVRQDQQRAVIEYFGVRGDADYDEMAVRKREYWTRKDGWHFAELNPDDIAPGPCHYESVLRSHLERFGITCHRLSEDEIWSRVRCRAISRLGKIAASFVQRCRKTELSSQALRIAIEAHAPLGECERAFLGLAGHIHSRYLSRLRAEGEDDFDGLLQRACDEIEAGNGVFRSPERSGDLASIRFLMIDEYQDLSPLFHRLVQAIRVLNPSVQVFAVGDDRQAINGFAGSDLKYFHGFKDDCPPAGRLSLTTNYRSDRAIVEFGNRLMQDGGIDARPASDAPGRVVLVDLSAFEPTEMEQRNHNGSSITALVRRILAHSLAGEGRVALLSRSRTLPFPLARHDRSLEACREEWFAGLSPADRQRIDLCTAHGYKGLEAATVVILDAIDGRYPLIHPDWVFARLFGDTIDSVVDAERRLFHVACTRAVSTLVLVTERGRESPFLTPIKGRCQSIDWREFPPAGTISRWVVRVGTRSSSGRSATFPVHTQLGAAGFDYRPGRWTHWVKVVDPPAELQPFLDGLCSEQWATEGIGLEVRITDQNDRPIGTWFVSRGQHSAKQ